MNTIAGQNVCVFDLEIKNLVDLKAGIGWKDYDKMGISVGGVFSYRTMSSHVFMDDNIHELPQFLCEHDLVSGFNIDGFDIPLLLSQKLPNGESFAQLFNRPMVTYDLLYFSRRATGWTDDQPFPKAMRLDDHLEATFGMNWVKTGDGADAPALWQSGKLGKLISYNLDDVKRECKLFERAWDGLPIATAKNGAHILHPPQDFLLTAMQSASRKVAEAPLA